MSLNIGDEISINTSLDKALSAYRKGDKVKLEISGTVIGLHAHALGKKPEQMIDIRFDGLECEEMEEEDGQKESAD